jgi:hypothetical protein
MHRLALIALAVAAVGCGGSLNEPDAGSGQLGGSAAGGTTGTTGAGGTDGGILIVDVRPPDEPCSLEVPATAVASETCRFYLPPPSCSYADNNHIGVRVGSFEIPRDSTGQNGWDYSDATLTTFTIYGASCDAVTGGAGVTIIYKILI